MTFVTERTKKILDEAKIKYEMIKLPQNISLNVADHMAFHQKPMKNALATMIYVTEKGMVAVQRRGDSKVSAKKLREFLKVKRLRLAEIEELAQLGYQPGLVPCAGIELPMYADQKMLEIDEIYTGLGDNDYGVRTNPQDLVRVNKSVIGNFTDYEEAIAAKRVFSGTRATGRLHLGNYLGAVKGYIALQNDPQYECVYMAVDVHTITTPFDHKTLQFATRDIVMDYLAAGLDPEKAIITKQSLVPEHTELSFLFSSVMSVARMQDLPTFKDKIRQHPENVTMALLNYPVLMAADILVYKAGLVPVGVDQEPHLEVAREIARKMNEQYGLDFPEPKRFATAGEYVPSLAGAGKMSKSVEGSYINLTDDLETIRKRLAGAPTDGGRGESVPAEGGVANLLKFVELFEGKEKRANYEAQYTGSGIRYGELKQELAEAINNELTPIREKRKELEARIEYVDRVIREGADKARKIAGGTISEVKAKMGLG